MYIKHLVLLIAHHQTLHLSPVLNLPPLRTFLANTVLTLYALEVVQVFCRRRQQSRSRSILCFRASSQQNHYSNTFATSLKDLTDNVYLLHSTIKDKLPLRSSLISLYLVVFSYIITFYILSYCISNYIL